MTYGVFIAAIVSLASWLIAPANLLFFYHSEALLLPCIQALPEMGLVPAIGIHIHPRGPVGPSPFSVYTHSSHSSPPAGKFAFFPQPFAGNFTGPRTRALPVHVGFHEASSARPIKASLFVHSQGRSLYALFFGGGGIDDIISICWPVCLLTSLAKWQPSPETVPNKECCISLFNWQSDIVCLNL